MSSSNYLDFQLSDALPPQTFRIGESAFRRFKLEGLIGMILRVVDGNLVLERIDLNPYLNTYNANETQQSIKAPTFDVVVIELISDRIKTAAR